MTTITAQPHPGRETRNPYERVLWTVAAVLLIGSAAATVTTHNIYMGNTAGWGPTMPTEIYIAQLLNAFAPGAFTGGLVMTGMAITTRVLKFDRRAEMMNMLALAKAAPGSMSHPDATNPPASGANPTAGTIPTSPVRPGSGPSSAPVDHSLYMRPQSTD
jgi:hypothetical protein